MSGDTIVVGAYGESSVGLIPARPAYLCAMEPTGFATKLTLNDPMTTIRSASQSASAATQSSWALGEILMMDH
jgi:hypothetical protein